MKKQNSEVLINKYKEKFYGEDSCKILIMHAVENNIAFRNMNGELVYKGDLYTNENIDKMMNAIKNKIIYIWSKDLISIITLDLFDHYLIYSFEDIYRDINNYRGSGFFLQGATDNPEEDTLLIKKAIDYLFLKL